MGSIEPTRRPRLVPFIYVFSLGAIALLTFTPWRPQTPWAMVCTTLISAVALVLAYMDDSDSVDNDEDDDASED